VVNKLKKLVAVSAECVACPEQPCVRACVQKHAECAELGWGHLYIVSGAGAGGETVPIVCAHCEDAPCVAACNRGALPRNRLTNAIVLDKYGCNLCGLCVPACPSGLISEGRKTVVKCDLCGGDPQCVKACPNGALLYVEEDGAH
jgi:Fe-S-cluster-containing hydrogenase component 2